MRPADSKKERVHCVLFVDDDGKNFFFFDSEDDADEEAQRLCNDPTCKWVYVGIITKQREELP